MKSIAQQSLGEGDRVFTTAKLINQVCGTSIQGMNLTQMRIRIRILDALDAAGDGDILLEDSDFTVMTEAINAMPWALADRNLLAVIDGILNAKKFKAEKTVDKVDAE